MILTGPSQLRMFSDSLLCFCGNHIVSKKRRWRRDGRMLVQGWKAGMGAQCHCRHSQHQVAPVLKIFFLLFLSNQQIILQQNARWFFFQRHGKRHRFTYTFVYVCIYFNCSAGHLMESGVLPCCPPPPAPSKRCAQCSTSLQLL